MNRRATLYRLSALLSALAIALIAVAPAGAQGFGKNKVRYKDFDWRVYHSPHFDVYYYSAEEHLLEKVVSYAESAYDQLSQEFDFQIQDATALIFYETHADFEQNNIILNFIPEGTGAFATPVRNRMVLPVDLPGPELMALILHELTHIFEFHILFGGNLGKGVAAQPPTWFMEGLASYMAKDESARDKMYLRDAVVNDRIPSVRGDISGFFAYRFGHAVFDFIEERYGKEGIRDFMIEMRSTLGGRVGRAIERTFNEDPEDFDSDFRRWLRKKYLPQLVETGEPSDFGRPFRLGQGPRGIQTSPTASPSGDLLAAFNTVKGEIDVWLFDARNRQPLRNLTKGYETEFQYLVAQELTLGRKMGRDLDFSPDGNQVAVFARQNKGRKLVLLNVLKSKVDRVYEMDDVGQQFSPAWSPDGRTIAFSGHAEGRFDIWQVDLDSGALSRVTDDDIYDGAPTWAPDGESLVITSVVGGFEKLFRVRLDAPGERIPVPTGELTESNETDAVFSKDGKRLYFTSDGTGANNIFSLDFESGQVVQHTDSVTGCYMPTVLPQPDGSEKIVFTSFWKGRFDLYLQDVDDPITEPTIITGEQVADASPLPADELPRFEPSIEVAIDDANKDEHRGFRFFLEDVGGTIGISDDQTFVALAILQFSDFIGDRRILAAFQSIESFQNFDVYYSDLSRRIQYQLHLYDNRDFFRVRDQAGFIRRGEQALSYTGLEASAIYPLNFSHRAELGLSYNLREIDFFQFADVLLESLSDEELLAIVEEFELQLPPDTTPEQLRELFELAFPDGRVPISVISPRDDDYPQLRGGLVGDTAVFASWGAVTGRRWRLSGSWAPDTADSGTLTSNVTVDFRQYIPLTRRSNFAVRLFGTMSDGNFASPIYFGGLDTVRGIEFRSLSGDHGFFGNFEFRFPLIDVLATPVIGFQGIRGVFFLDVGGAWFDNFQDFDFWDQDERLEDAVSSYGYGVTFRLFGIDVNLDFAKRWDFEDSADGYESSIWLGRRF